MDSFLSKVVTLLGVAIPSNGHSIQLPFDMLYGTINPDIKYRVTRMVKINLQRLGLLNRFGSLQQVWTDSVDDPLVRSVLVISAHNVIDAMEDPQRPFHVSL